jgi:hypothetical protein
MLTTDELNRWLRDQWARRGYTLADGERHGVELRELVDHSAERARAKDLPDLELWVAMYDEMVSWLLSLQGVFQRRMKAGQKLSDFEKAIFLVLARIIADAISLRHLILLGFDTSGRTLLRSTAEYMEVLVAIIDDPPFAAEFLKSDSPETAKVFWEQHLRSGRIRRRVRAAWRRFATGDTPEDEAAALWFASWGNQWTEQLSSLTHPSLGACLLTINPPQVKPHGDAWLGHWGDKADFSAETIYIFAANLFPILAASRGFPFEGFNGVLAEPIPYDETDEEHRHIRLGRDVIGSLILSLGTPNNAGHVFPKFDLEGGLHSAD